MARPTLIVVLASILLMLVGAASAEARPAPAGFFGVVYSPPGIGAPYPGNEPHVARMGRAGVETLRVNFTWGSVERDRGVLDWGLLDPIVRSAAANGVSLAPLVITTPRWASEQPDSDRFSLFAPRDPGDYARFLRRLIGRYGPKGRFWAENPGIRRRPIRHWQIWNEPSAEYLWRTPNYRRSYPRLLRVAYRAVHRADRGAKVVMAGLASFEHRGRLTTSWQDLRSFYRAGARRYFDILAIHPFARDLEGVVRTIKLNRRVMKRYRDSRKPIWVTELSWPAAKGQLAPAQQLGFEVTPARQRKLMAAAYRRFINDRGLGVKRAFWYTWASTYSTTQCGGASLSFEFTGLVQSPCGGTSLTPLPLLSTYARLTRRY